MEGLKRRKNELFTGHDHAMRSLLKPIGFSRGFLNMASSSSTLSWNA